MTAGNSVRTLFTFRRLTGASSVLIGANIASNVLRLGGTLLLTRLLAPQDFGLLAIVGSIFFVIGLITDAGFEAYIVRHERGDDPHFLDAIWSIHFGRGVMNCAAAAILAFPLALLLHKPTLAPLLAVASVSMMIDGAASLTLLTALRNGLIRRLSVIDLIAQIGQFATSVIFAWLLRSAWALVISLITLSMIRTIASYMIFPDARRRLRLDRPLTKELWRFSRLIAASSALALVISQIDKLMLARALPLDQFGIYAIATNLATAPIAIAGQYISRIFYPAIAHAWRAAPEEIGARYYALRGIVFYAYIFAGGALIGSGQLIVRILYDPRYLHAGFYLRLLAVTTTLTMMTRSANDTLVAIGQTRTTLTANFIRLCWLLPIGLLAFLMVGPLGLIATLATIEVPAYVYISAMLARFGIFDRRREYLAWTVIAGGVIAGLSLESLASFVTHLY